MVLVSESSSFDQALLDALKSNREANLLPLFVGHCVHDARLGGKMFLKLTDFPLDTVLPISESHFSLAPRERLLHARGTEVAKCVPIQLCSLSRCVPLTNPERKRESARDRSIIYVEGQGERERQRQRQRHNQRIDSVWDSLHLRIKHRTSRTGRTCSTGCGASPGHDGNLLGGTLPRGSGGRGV